MISITHMKRAYVELAHLLPKTTNESETVTLVPERSNHHQLGFKIQHVKLAALSFQQ